MVASRGGDSFWRVVSIGNIMPRKLEVSRLSLGFPRVSSDKRP